MAHVTVLCVYVVSSWFTVPPSSQVLGVCEDVGAAALVEGLSPALVIALAFTESRLNAGARSSRGAVGPLQVLPWFHCPGRRERGCDLVAAGVKSITRFQLRFGDGWLCHWNSGNECYRRSRLFARIVLGRAAELSRARGERCRR